MSQPLSNALLHDLKELFYGGDLLPGDTLMSQRKMAQHYQVSRATVREAVVQLESEGFIDVQHGGKTRCRNLLEPYFDLPLEGLGDNLEFQLQVMDVRAMLEGEAAYYTALRGSNAQLQALDREYQRMCQRGQDGTTLSKAKDDLRFHMMIAESSHHLLIISFSQIFYSRFFNAIYGVLSRTLKKYGRYPDGIRSQHAVIHQAIMQRDAAAARAAAVEHILYTRRHLEADPAKN